LDKKLRENTSMEEKREREHEIKGRKEGEKLNTLSFHVLFLHKISSLFIMKITTNYNK